MRPGLDAVQVIAAVDRGLRRARDAFNRRPEVADGREPPFEYGIICCAMRMFTRGYSQYYDTLFDAHPYTRPKNLFAMASIDLARAAIIARDGTATRSSASISRARRRAIRRARTARPTTTRTGIS